MQPFSNSRDKLAFHFLVHSTLDVFDARLPSKTNGDSDFGLLYAVDENLACYGWLTNTGIKFVVAVEAGGVRDGDLKGLFRSLQTAYIRLVCNPFYEPDENRPIESKRFLAEVRYLAENWKPGAPTPQ